MKNSGRYRFIVTAGLMLLAGFTLSAQGLLTADEAVAIARRQNYDILTARTSADIDRVNNTAGNAGMLPDIGIGASDAFALNHVNTSLSTGNTISSNNAQVNTFSTGLSLNWTLFDGGKMFVTRKKLRETESLGEIQYSDKVQQVLYNVILSYYEVVRQKQQLAAINEVIRYNRERTTILQAGFNAGLFAKTDLLQSQVDLNIYLENAIIQQTVILDAKRNLNQLLCRDPEVPFETADSIELTYVSDSADLQKRLFGENTQVLSYGKQADISALTTRELAAQRLPWLSMNAGYDFLYSTNTAGTVRRNQTYGPQLGGSFSLPIWYGGNINRQVRVARLQEQAASYGLENAKKLASTQLQNALSDYRHALQLLELERSNTALAKENLTIAMHRLRLGQTTSLEVRQAEESYIQSLTRFTLFGYTAKAAETRLRQLVAGL